MNLSEFDISLLRDIHHHRILALDGFFYYFSFITTYITISILLTILIVGIRKKSVAMRMKFFKLLSVFAASAIVSLTIKNLFFRQRPFASYPDIVKLSEAGSSSFPSGHTMEAFAIAFAFSTLFPNPQFIIPIYLWAIMVGYSRMALGVHYPLDIIGGIMLGTLVSFLTLKFFDYRLRILRSKQL